MESSWKLTKNRLNASSGLKLPHPSTKQNLLSNCINKKKGRTMAWHWGKHMKENGNGVSAGNIDDCGLSSGHYKQTSPNEVHPSNNFRLLWTVFIDTLLGMSAGPQLLTAQIWEDNVIPARPWWFLFTSWHYTRQVQGPVCWHYRRTRRPGRRMD